MAQRIYLTAEEKILIHLFEYSKFRNQWEVPFNVTQEGIASAVGIARCNVSREIKKLREKNFIEERVAHIKSVVRKRKVYFLSMDGMVPAKQIKSHMENSQIRFRNKDGGLIEIKLIDLNKYLEVRPTMLEVLKHISSDGIIDYRALHVELTQDYLDFTDKAPSLKYFFGREDEIKGITSILEQGNKRIIVIQGLAGVGKTALATKLLEDYKQKMNIFWFKFYEWSTLHNLLTHISDFLKPLNRTRLKSYIETVKRLDINEISEILTVDLKDLQVLLIFDDMNKIENNPKTKQFFQSLIELSYIIKGLKIVFLSRQFIQIYTPKDSSEEGIVSEISLYGLDENSSNKLLAQRQVEPEKFKRIYELTKGHPLFLELVNPQETLNNLSLHSDIKKYIHSEIFMKLPEDSRKLLGIASVFRFPIKASVFFTDPKISYDTIDRLVEKRFLIEFAGGYVIHDLVREFFYNRLTPHVRLGYHKSAADYYTIEFERLSVSAVMDTEEDSEDDPKETIDTAEAAKKPSPEVLNSKMDKKFLKERKSLQLCLEAQYHSIMAEDHKEASRLAIDEGVRLISHGFLDEFMANLEKFSETNIGIDEWTTVQIFMGDILTIQGNWDNALKHYNISLNSSVKHGFKLKVAEAYRNIGAINFRRGDLVRATEFLHRAKDVSEKENDYHGIANVNYWLGVVLNRQGEYDKAIEHFNKCMTFAEKINFLPGIAKTYTGISDVLVNKGEYENAITNYMKSIDILDKTGNIFEKSEIYNRIGITYCKQGGHEDSAIKYYSKRIDISRNLGDIRGEGYGLSNAAECYASKGQLQTALDFCDRALAIFKKMDEKRMVSNTLMVYGIVYGYKHEWIKSVQYFNDAMKIAKDINSLDLQAQIHFNFGFAMRDLGKSLNAGYQEQLNPLAASERIDRGNIKKDKIFRTPKNAKEAIEYAKSNLLRSIEIYRNLKNIVKVEKLTREVQDLSKVA